MRIIHSFTLLLLLTCTTAFAQPQVNFSFEHLTVQDGLANKMVNDIMQDHKGYIWMATQNGLQRYDGQRFMNWHKTFGNPFSLPSDNVAKILEDHANNIWVACHNGVALLNPSNYLMQRVPIDLDSSFTDLNIYNFFEDSKRRIWLVTKEAGILILDTLSRHFVKLSNFLPAHAWRFTNILEEPVTGNYWLSSDSGIAYADMKKKAIYTCHNNPDNHPVLSNPDFKGKWVVRMFIDSYYKLWITNYSNIGNKFDGKYEYSRYNLFTKKIETYKPQAGGNFMMYQDHEGDIWLAGGNRFQVWRPETNSIYLVDKANEMSQGMDAEIVTKLCADREHNIWVATDNGVYIFNPSAHHINIKQFHDEQTGKPTDLHFVQFTELPNQKIWAASWGNHIIEFDQQMHQTKVLQIAPRSDDENYKMVWSFYKTKDSTMFVGCQLGRLALYDLAKKTFKVIEDSAFDKRTIRTIIGDKKGNVWFGTQHGLLVKWDIETKRFIRYVDKEYPRRENLGNIMKLCIDNENRMWAATQYSGLIEIDQATGSIKKRYRVDDENPQGMSSNGASDIIQYNDSLLWVSSALGINILNKKTGLVEHITTEDGLISNNILSLQKDNNGFVWTATADGFYKIAWPSKKIVRFARRDGIINDIFQPAGLCMLKDGRLLSATSKDFLWFYPDSLINKKEPPKVEITYVKIFNNEVNIDSILGGNKLLELGYQENFVSIEFAALGFSNRNRLTYYYQMEGLDKDWIKTNNYLLSSYANLKPGLYTYRVYAETSEGVRGPVSSFQIRIMPPWWNRWWFYCICLAAFLGILYLLHRIRVNKILDMEKVRTRIARDLHDDMGSTLSTINILSEMAKRKVRTDTEKTQEYIEKISDNSQRMMEAMDDIVWSINPTNDSMQRIIARMREYATNILEAKDIDFTFRADETLNDLKINLESRRDLFLVFKESVNNLAKYSKTSCAHIAIKTHKKNVVMLVEDEGIGFDTKAADSGNGLTNMKKRAELMKGRLEIKSAIGKGTRVILEVPL